MNKKDLLIKKIEDKREELYRAGEKGIDQENVLKTSQELDILLNEFERLKNKCN